MQLTQIPHLMADYWLWLVVLQLFTAIVLSLRKTNIEPRVHFICEIVGKQEKKKSYRTMKKYANSLLLNGMLVALLALRFAFHVMWDLLFKSCVY